MLRMLNTIMEIRGVSGANRLIYYFRGIPVLGKTMKDSVYSNWALKKTFTVIALILRILFAFSTRFAYLGLIIYLPVLMAAGDLPLTQQYDLYLHILVLLSFAVSAVSNAIILESKRDKYICVKLMRMPADKYMHATLGLKGISFFIYFVPAMMVFAGVFGAPLWHGILLALLLTLWRTAAEALHLLVFDRKGVVVVKQNALVWSVIGIGYALAFLPLYTGSAWLDMDNVLISLPAVLAVLLPGIIAVIYIARYPRYRNAVDAVTKIDDPLLDMSRMMKEANRKQVETKEQDISAEQLRPGQFTGKNGYAYLNAIFFSRHRRLLVQPIQRRLMIIAGLSAAGLLLQLTAPDLFAQLIRYLIGGLPVFVIVMNFTSIGELVCKAMFFNCDLSLLRYGFYRERAAILSNFRIRLLRLSGLNLIPAAAICLALNLLIFLSGEGWSAAEALIFSGTVLGLSLFFSVHHLFMYYIFQPYSTELNMRNPFFTIVNSIITGVAVIALQFKGAPAQFALFVLLAAAVYTLIALVLVYRYSHRTFRVK
ncbi:hypothetical protein [Paenibacillus sp. FSL R7-0331]|uniref:hypothetical protein n=1 Tax=Paenibacillus sp. FSL R7-0331 TaxID=1536773 RepID=UPI0004F6DC74|nr:hypothetical protein [Paenibacillus sp. FSL R7-0331]AIQ51645.1 hypothetical protein R70331_09015 [Paenibacillus sp. FSL R7-0331]